MTTPKSPTTRPAHRPIDCRRVKQVQRLRAKGYTYRKIAAKIDKDVKSVFRWAKCVKCG